LFLDSNQQAFFLNFSANCWLAVRLEMAGTLIATFAALFAVLGRDSKKYGPLDTTAISNHAVYAGLAGLSISFALSVTQSLNWSVRMASDLESQMVSVERVKAYSDMDQEAPHFSENDPSSSSSTSSSTLSGVQSGQSWPSAGEIQMNSVCLRYRQGLPLVLDNLTLTIKSKEKIGIVGRTGAGKSSLVTAILRMVEMESGSILIDGIDISSIGLHALRSRIAVIPQDPVLFSGTIRSNLDPFLLYTDAQIWENLRRTMLASSIGSLDDLGTFSVRNS
jgi:ABC-type multidrug transport system fused ATPase/permease subunit